MIVVTPISDANPVDLTVSTKYPIVNYRIKEMYGLRLLYKKDHVFRLGTCQLTKPIDLSNLDYNPNDTQFLTCICIPHLEKGREIDVVSLGIALEQQVTALRIHGACMDIKYYTPQIEELFAQLEIPILFAETSFIEEL